MFLVLFLAACATNATSDDTADVDAYCETAPDVTWVSFGAGALQVNCQGCHTADALERTGAPFALDSADDVWAHDEEILGVLQDDRMPPQGGLSEGDEELFRAWLLCGDPGT